MKIIKEILFLIAYLAMWIFAMLFYTFLNEEGFRVDYGIAYGNIIKIIYMLIVGFVFFSFIIIKVLYKKCPDWIRYIVSFSLSIILFISVMQIDKYTVNNMEFSKTMWEKHPQTRMVLYEKIEQNYNIYTYSKQEVVDLLGTPDDVDNQVFIYSDGNGNDIYIYFKDDIVCDMYAFD